MKHRPSGFHKASYVKNTITEYLTSGLCYSQKRNMYTTTQVGHKVGEKFPEFSRLFQSHILTFAQVTATESKCNNDLHQGSFHVHSSNITGHHSTLTMSEIHETLCS